MLRALTPLAGLPGCTSGGPAGSGLCRLAWRRGIDLLDAVAVVTDEGHSAAARAASIVCRIEAETTSPLGVYGKDTIHRLLYRLVEQLHPDALSVDCRS